MDISDGILYVAEVFGEKNKFQRRAKETAEKFGSHALTQLPSYFHNTPEKPTHLIGSYEGLGEWMSVCQQAIFEIFFHIGESSVDHLKKVAFGEYDWTQITALKTLCRFARAGVRSRELVDEISDHLSGFREEALFPIVGCLCTAGIKSDRLKKNLLSIIDEYSGYSDPVDSLHLLEHMANLYPDVTRCYTQFLVGLVRGDGLEDRHPMLDGAIIRKPEDGPEEIIWGESGPPATGVHSLRAACLLYRLREGGIEIENYLERMRSTHPDENIRSELTTFLLKDR